MKELLQFPFRCTKLKCGVIWAVVVTSGLVLPLAASHWKSLCAVVSPRVWSFLTCWGRFLQLGRCSRRGDSTRSINTNWKTCPISVFIWLFNNCLFSLGIRKSGSIMLKVTQTNYCKCRSQYVLVKLFCIILLLRFAYGGVLLMTAFLKNITYS